MSNAINNKFGMRNARAGTLILSIAYALSIFQRTAFPQLDATLTKQFHLTSGQSADLSASFFWVYLVLQIPSGLMADALGAHKTSIIGALVAAMGCALFSLSDSLSLLVSSRMLISAGSTIAFVTMLRYATVHFPDDVGAMTGRGLLVGNIGGIMSGIPLTFLLFYFTYHAIWIGLAICLLLIAAGITYFAPTDKISKGFKGHFKFAGSDIKNVLMSPWCYVGMLLLAGLGGTYYSFCGGIAIKILGSSGIAQSKDGWMMTLLLGGFAFGAYFWGWLSDKAVDAKRLLVFALTGNLVSWIVVTGHVFTSPMMLGVMFSLMGWFAGAVSLTYRIVTSKYSANLGGVAIGVMNCGIPLGAALFITMAGRMKDQYVLLPMVTVIVIALVAATIIWVLHVLSGRKYGCLTSGDEVASETNIFRETIHGVAPTSL